MFAANTKTQALIRVFVYFYFCLVFVDWIPEKWFPGCGILQQQNYESFNLDIIMNIHSYRNRVI